MSPLETVSDVLSSTPKPLIYTNLLDNEETLKSSQQLLQAGLSLDCWQ